ncbi:MAG: transglutaminase family protein [Hyphomicrobium sp.]
MEIRASAKLRYVTTAPTPFFFQFEVAKTSAQVVRQEELILPPQAARERYVDPISGTRRLRTILGPGPVEVIYKVVADLTVQKFAPEQVREFEFVELPFEVIEFLAPSRYCASDTFTDFAFDTFGNQPRGYQRVMSICDWIFNNVAYVAGSTGPSTTAADVFHSKEGVCRDFAHLAIALCRACAIPARYTSVYADRLSPQDFHALFQVYLCGPSGGDWFTFDATQMSSPDSVLAIASGRDSADVAFAWPQGEVEGEPPEIEVLAPGRRSATITDAAVSAP